MGARAIFSGNSATARRIESGRQHELHGIEVLRFFCAFSILVFHYQHLVVRGILDGATSAAIRPQLPFYGMLKLFYEHGASAVQTFWVISGFIFYWRYAEWVRTGDISLWKFTVHRFSRLYPLHLVTLIAVALLQFFYLRSHGTYFIYGDNSPSAFLEQLFFASNWFRGQPYSFNAPIWSVSAEILVYVGFFFIARLAGSRPLAAIVACIGAYVIPLVLRTPISNYVWECNSFFFAGGVACWIWRSGWTASALTIGAGIIVGMAARHISLHFWSLMLVTMWLAIAFAGIGQNAVMRKLAILGNATYSSYLLHFPIQLALVQLVDIAAGSRTIFLSRFAFILYLLLITVTSLVIFHAFEHPVQNRLRRMLLVKREAARAVKSA